MSQPEPQPQPPAQPAAPPALGPLGYRLPKPLRGLSLAVIALLVADILLEIAEFAATSSRIGVVRDFLNGGAADAQAIRDADNADSAVQATSAVSVLLFIATAVVFIIWAYRLVSNVRSFGHEPKPGPGWAIGGWFVPVLNAWFPARTLWKADQHADSAGRENRWLIVAWWLALIVSSGLDRTALVSSNPGDSTYISDVLHADERTRIATVGLAIAAVCAILMVRNLTGRQERALQQFTGLYGPGGTLAYRSPSQQGWSPAGAPLMPIAPLLTPPVAGPLPGPQYGAPGTDD